MVVTRTITNAISVAGRTAGNHIHFICSTEAELPSLNVINGDEATCHDTGRAFIRTNDSWVPSVSSVMVATHRAGLVTLLDGTATILNGTVTPKTVVITAFKTLIGTSAGILTWTVVDGVSFTITSVGATGAIVATDLSTVCYVLLESP